MLFVTKKIAAFTLIIAMTLTNAGVSTFATSVQYLTSTVERDAENLNKKDYRIYEEFKYEERSSVLLNGGGRLFGENNNLNDTGSPNENPVEKNISQDSVSDGAINTTTGDDTKTTDGSSSFDGKNDENINDDSAIDTNKSYQGSIDLDSPEFIEPRYDKEKLSTNSNADEELDNDQDIENTNDNSYEEEPEESILTQSDIEEAEEHIANVEELEEDKDENISIQSDIEEAEENIENVEEPENDDKDENIATQSDIEEAEENIENVEEPENDDKDIATQSDIKEAEENIENVEEAEDDEVIISSLSNLSNGVVNIEEELFGISPDDYVLPATWAETIVNAGYAKDMIRKITFKKSPAATPATSLFNATIPDSNGLELYVTQNTTLGYANRDITIYAPTDGTIYLASDASSLFDGCNHLVSINNLSYLDTSNVTNMSYMFNYCMYLTTLDLRSFDTSNVTNMDAMFAGCSSLTTLDVTHFNTSNVTNMRFMFRDCRALTTLDVTHFDTSSVRYMGNMFMGCSSLTTLDVTSFDTSNVFFVEQMFYQCSSLTTLDVTHFDTSSVRYMYGMFRGCSSLTTIDVSSFNTSNVTEMGTMFDGCSSLTALDLSGFATSNVVEMGYMFRGCSSLTTLDLSSFDTSNATEMYGMFQNCSSLTVIDLGGFNTRNVTDMSEMFAGCTSLTTLDVSSFNTSNVTSMFDMFNGDTNLATIIASTSFVTTSVTSDTDMFTNCTALTGGSGTTYVNKYALDPTTAVDRTFARIDGLGGLDGYFTGLGPVPGPAPTPATNYVLPVTWANTFVNNAHDRSTIKTITFEKAPAVAPATAVFNATIPNSNGLELYMTQNATAGYYDITIYAPTNGIIYAPVDASGLFPLYRQLESINNLEYLDTSNVTSMYGMFHDCSSLTTLDLSSFDTSNVTSMFDMFFDCTSLTTLDISSFNTINVTNINSMFSDCTSLTTLDVTHFDTRNVTSMWFMFSGCSSLTTLDVSSFDTSSVTDMREMFAGCTSLRTIIASTSFVTTSETADYYMFSNCRALTGGSGTTYANKYAEDSLIATGKTFAWIDGRHGVDGYFTSYGQYSGVDTDNDGTRVGSMRIISAPSKVNYIESEHFDPAGLEIEEVWNDGYTKSIIYDATTMNDFTFNPAITSELKVSDTQVSVTYKGYSDIVAITVMKESVDEIDANVVSIKIVKNPSKVTYVEGSKLKPSGLVIEVRYPDGKETKRIAYNNYPSKFGFNPSINQCLTIGIKTVTVSFGGMTDTFTINVIKQSNTNNNTSGRGSSGSSGGSGGGGGGSITKNLEFVVSNVIPESDCIWEQTGERIALKVKSTNMVAQALMKSELTKNYYTLVDGGANIRLQGNGLFRVGYLGNEYYFGFDLYGNMISGFYSISSSTKIFQMKNESIMTFTITQQVVSPQNTNINTGIGDQIFNVVSGVPGKYYLYEQNGIYKGILWNKPTIVNGIEYKFDLAGRVLSIMDYDEKVGSWEYNPIENAWRYHIVDIDGTTSYYKGGVYDVMSNGTINRFIFDVNGIMLTGVAVPFNGQVYETELSGIYEGAIRKIIV